MKKKIFFTCIALCFSLNLFSQSIIPDQPFLLNLDYSRFHYDEQAGFLEIYYSFYPEHLTYNFVNNTFCGGVILSTKIMDKKTDQFVVNETSILTISEEDTGGVWYKFPFITKYDFVVPNGDYTLDVLAVDSLEGSRRDSIKLDLKIEPYGNELETSDIELCKSISSSQNSSGLFFKNSLEVVPYPSLFFGATSVPVMFHYVEIYNLDTDTDYTLKTEVIDSRGSVIRQSSKPRKFPATNSIEMGTTPVTSYISGKYIFRITLLDDQQEALLNTDKVFYIYNPHIEVARATPENEGVEKLTDEELNQEFLYAKYIATKQETDLFKQINNYDAKVKFLRELWDNVAKGRGHFPPILRSEYIARVKIANEKYKAWRKEGWETDQGRVFIVYSTPDEVERAPSVSDSKPYEVWRYFNIEGGVEFYFADRTGTNLLELVHSTKRGELYDENWQRFIGK